ncbi:MAG: alkaline phosphatase family protein [bacterium]|nr:MAG: alkaline phosphatase family protein [bacterium]
MSSFASAVQSGNEECGRGSTDGIAVQNGDSIQYVIHISIDGLRPDAVTTLGPLNVPHFYRLRIEGAYTDNARTDYDFTNTLPNHTCMLTGRPVNGPEGHNVDFNSDTVDTIEDAHGSYVAGVFDVLHDRGFGTAIYASKSKFALFDRSWNEVNGAPDTVGADNGRDKIDRYVYDSNTSTLTDTFLADMASGLYTYSFVHYRDPDATGHSYGWNSPEYYDVVIAIDGYLGSIFYLVENDPVFLNKTAIILISDHGGHGTGHSDPTLPANYTIPCYVWGPGIPAGADLYWLNPASRLDPGGGRPDYSAEPQPIRNGGTSNLALGLLGLVAIPGSSIDDLQDLDVFPPGGVGDLPVVFIVNPEDDATFQPLDTVTFEASASTAMGAIEKVEFFANWNKLGDDATLPYTFTWNGLPLGSFTITARAVRDDSIAAVSNISIVVFDPATDAAEIETSRIQYRLYPNPLSTTARIDFSMVRSGRAGLVLYDVSGRRIRTLPLGWREQGRHSVHVNASGLPPGLYFFRLHLGGRIETGKCMIVR